MVSVASAGGRRSCVVPPVPVPTASRAIPVRVLIAVLVRLCRAGSVSVLLGATALVWMLGTLLSSTHATTASSAMSPGWAPSSVAVRTVANVAGGPSGGSGGSSPAPKPAAAKSSSDSGSSSGSSSAPKPAASSSSPSSGSGGSGSSSADSPSTAPKPAQPAPSAAPAPGSAGSPGAKPAPQASPAAATTATPPSTGAPKPAQPAAGASATPPGTGVPKPVTPQADAAAVPQTGCGPTSTPCGGAPKTLPVTDNSTTPSVTGPPKPAQPAANIADASVCGRSGPGCDRSILATPARDTAPGLPGGSTGSCGANGCPTPAIPPAPGSSTPLGPTNAGTGGPGGPGHAGGSGAARLNAAGSTDPNNAGATTGAPRENTLDPNQSLNTARGPPAPSADLTNPNTAPINPGPVKPTEDAASQSGISGWFKRQGSALASSVGGSLQDTADEVGGLARDFGTDTKNSFNNVKDMATGHAFDRPTNLPGETPQQTQDRLHPFDRDVAAAGRAIRDDPAGSAVKALPYAVGFGVGGVANKALLGRAESGLLSSGLSAGTRLLTRGGNRASDTPAEPTAPPATPRTGPSGPAQNGGPAETGGPAGPAGSGAGRVLDRTGPGSGPARPAVGGRPAATRPGGRVDGTGPGRPLERATPIGGRRSPVASGSTSRTNVGATRPGSRPLTNRATTDGEGESAGGVATLTRPEPGTLTAPGRTRIESEPEPNAPAAPGRTRIGDHQPDTSPQRPGRPGIGTTTDTNPSAPGQRPAGQPSGPESGLDPLARPGGQPDGPPTVGGGEKARGDVYHDGQLYRWDDKQQQWHSIARVDPGAALPPAGGSPAITSSGHPRIGELDTIFKGQPDELERYQKLSRLPSDQLSAADFKFVHGIREQLSVEPAEPMTKVLGKDGVDKMLNGTYSADQVYGFVARGRDTDQLRTPKQLRDGLALTPPLNPDGSEVWPSPIPADGSHAYQLTWTARTDRGLSVPYGAPKGAAVPHIDNVIPGDPRRDGEPFTGTGTTAGGIPEWHANRAPITGPAQIWHLDQAGNRRLYAEYDPATRTWKLAP